MSRVERVRDHGREALGILISMEKVTRSGQEEDCGWEYQEMEGMDENSVVQEILSQIRGGVGRGGGRSVGRKRDADQFQIV